MSDQSNQPPQDPNDPSGQGSGWGTPPPPPGQDQNPGWGGGTQGHKEGWNDQPGTQGQSGWNDQPGSSAAEPNFGGPPPNYGAGYGQPGAPGFSVPLKTSGMAVTALVLGILGLLSSWFLLGVPLALIAVILGIIGIARIKPENGLKGKGLAIGGLVTGIIGLIIAGLVWWAGSTIMNSPAFDGVLDGAMYCAENYQPGTSEYDQCIDDAAESLIDEGSF